MPDKEHQLAQTNSLRTSAHQGMSIISWIKCLSSVSQPNKFLDSNQEKN